MKNGISDLNNHLFEQLERLNDDELDLEKEIKKAKAMVDISEQILNLGHLQLQAVRIRENYGIKNEEMSELLYEKRNQIGVLK